MCSPLTTPFVILQLPCLLLVLLQTSSSCREDVELCFRKCCPPGQFLLEKNCTVTNNSLVLPLLPGGRPFGVVIGHECPSRTTVMMLDPDPTGRENFIDRFDILPDGRLLVPYGGVIYGRNDYCVDFIEDQDYPRALVCSKRLHLDISSKYYWLGMIISMPFLLLTFLVYAFLPDRNLHGRSLMCYVVSLFMAYLLLVILQLRFQTEEFSDTSCRGLAISCYFFFMVSFFWMNVMSIDIWSAFSGMRAVTSNKRHAEQRRFLIYCAYAWGVPLLMAIIVSTLSFWANLPPDVWYNPGVSDGQCWFREGLPTLVYFYGPMAIIIVSNITFFVVTAFKINRVQRDTSMLRKDESKKHSYENDKQRFNLYLKLMLAMGINWSLEVISWATKWKTHSDAFWYITDFANALYGVFIFFIFVFKRNIWKMVKRRYYSLMGKPLLGRSTTQTGYSSRTTASSINNQTLVSTVDCKSVSEDNVIVTTQVP